MLRFSLVNKDTKDINMNFWHRIGTGNVSIKLWHSFWFAKRLSLALSFEINKQKTYNSFVVVVNCFGFILFLFCLFLMFIDNASMVILLWSCWKWMKIFFFQIFFWIIKFPWQSFHGLLSHLNLTLKLWKILSSCRWKVWCYHNLIIEMLTWVIRVYTTIY